MLDLLMWHKFKSLKCARNKQVYSLIPQQVSCKRLTDDSLLQVLNTWTFSIMPRNSPTFLNCSWVLKLMHVSK